MKQKTVAFLFGAVLFGIALAGTFPVPEASAISNVANCKPGGAANWSLVGGVCVPKNTGLSNASISSILVTTLNWLLSIIAAVAVIVFIISGLQYLTSAGDESQAETAKKTMKFAINGIAVAFSGLIIISTVGSLLKGDGTSSLSGSSSGTQNNPSFPGGGSGTSEFGFCTGSTTGLSGTCLGSSSACPSGYTNDFDSASCSSTGTCCVDAGGGGSNPAGGSNPVANDGSNGSFSGGTCQSSCAANQNVIFWPGDSGNDCPNAGACCGFISGGEVAGTVASCSNGGVSGVCKAPAESCPSGYTFESFPDVSCSGGNKCCLPDSGTVTTGTGGSGGCYWNAAEEYVCN